MKQNTEKLAGWVYPVLVATMLLNVYTLHEIRDRPEEIARERPTDIVYPLADDEYLEALARRGPDLVVVELDEPDELDRFLLALAAVEDTSVEPGQDSGKAGKAGELGPLQIKRIYWFDAWEFAKKKGRYEDVTSYQYASDTAIRYWKRYCPKALARQDWETLARIHNGGPSGHRKQATVKYWEDVKAELNKRK